MDASLRDETRGNNLLVVLDENLNDDVAELDVHDGCDRLLLRPHQRRAETHAQVRHAHQILGAVLRHPATHNH